MAKHKLPPAPSECWIVAFAMARVLAWLAIAFVENTSRAAMVNANRTRLKVAVADRSERLPRPPDEDAS